MQNPFRTLVQQQYNTWTEIWGWCQLAVGAGALGVTAYGLSAGLIQDLGGQTWLEGKSWEEVDMTSATLSGLRGATIAWIASLAAGGAILTPGLSVGVREELALSFEGHTTIIYSTVASIEDLLFRAIRQSMMHGDTPRALPHRPGC
jgi:hypothetical protein